MRIASPLLPSPWFSPLFSRLFSPLLFVGVLACGACGGKTTDDELSDGALDGAVDTGTHFDDASVDGGGDPFDAGADVNDVADDADDFTRCGGPGTCVAIPRSCCGTCGSPSPDDVIAVESSHASDYRSGVCGPGVGCTDCFRPADPFLQAFCVSGRCAVVDLHTDAMTACSTDDDCQLRYEACCETCGAPGDGLLALRRDAIASYRASVCTGGEACPKCAVGYPMGAKAICDSTKHCAVTGVALPG